MIWGDFMGLSFKKRINLGGGVHLNIGKKGVGISVGVKGAGVSISSSGRKSAHVGIPGTGVSLRTSSGGGSGKKKGTAPKASTRPSRDDANIMIAQECLSRMQQSGAVLHDTGDLTAFIEHFNIMADCIGKLKMLQKKTPVLSLPTDIDTMLDEVKRTESRAFLIRNYNHVVNAAASLKTEKGRKGRYQKAIDQLNENRAFFGDVYTSEAVERFTALL